MEFLSTKKCRNNLGIGKLDRSSIFAQGRLRSLIIVSAYTDVSFIKSIKNSYIRHCDKRLTNADTKHLEIYLDESASKYHTCIEIKNELDRLSKDIKNNFDDDSGVFLVKCGALFHSKMVISESNTHNKIVVGSINLTQKAFVSNEEIALACEWQKDDKTKISVEYGRVKESVNNYLKKIRYTSAVVPIEVTSDKSSSLRNVLLRGKLFQEYKEQESFTFDMAFPKEYRNYLNENTTPVFDFLGSDTSGCISLSALIKKAKLKNPDFFNKDGEAERTSWKQYSVETCYGYWVPHDYLPLVKSCVERRKISKEGKLKTLLQFLNDNDEPLKMEFISIFGKIRENRKSLSSEYLGQWKFSQYNDESLTKEWNAWMIKIKMRIDFTNEKYRSYIERLCKGCSDVQVPDVWSDDPVSSEEFEQSLYDSLCYQFSVKNKSQRKICTALKQMDKFKKKTDIFVYPKKEVLESFRKCDFKSVLKKDELDPPQIY